MNKYVVSGVAAGALMGASVAVQAAPLSVPTSSLEDGSIVQRVDYRRCSWRGESGAVFGCAVNPACMDTTPTLVRKRIGLALRAGGGRWTTKGVAATGGVSSTKARHRVAA